MFYVIDRNVKTGNEVVSSHRKISTANKAATDMLCDHTAKGTIYVTNEHYYPVNAEGLVLTQYRQLHPDDNGF